MANLENTTLSERYFLRRKVGEGGSADVYEAWDQERTVKVAVKVLRCDEQDQERVGLFEQEASWLRRLEHPAILRLFELVRWDELIFMVIEWVEGKNLRQEIEELGRPYSPPEAAKVLEPICSALNYAHNQQVYHCDIKPANILLASSGRILLTDFGVARLASEGEGGGTPAYMAPEQILGRKVDVHTDIYSLGVTLYEMFSGGQLPFRGQHQNSRGDTPRQRVEWEHCYLPPPPLQDYNPTLPYAVANIVIRALAKEPQKRYSTALDLWRDIEQASKQYNSPRPAPTTIDSTLVSTKKPARIIPPVKPVLPSMPSVSTSQVLKGPYLVGYSGNMTGLSIPLKQERTSIGRNRENQIIIPDSSISRHHAVIIRGKREVYIQDLGSLLGTYVNGQRVTGTLRLKPGDVIHLGSAWIFEFRR